MDKQDNKFPAGLLNWAGHRDGGVKKPFSTSSGRPTGDLIETNLTHRLRVWANNLAAGQEGIPVAIFLVGGPGNGKTDAIETAIQLLDTAFGKNGQLLDGCASKFDVELPPRKIVVNLAEFVDESSVLHNRELVIIQDATEVDLEKPGSAPESLFLDDVESLLTTSERDCPLFLCGINRGILAHAALVGHAENYDPATLDFIDTLTRSATSRSGKETKACWPLDGYEWAVAWPMDVESLVDHPPTGDVPTPISQILEKALDSVEWTSGCNAGDLCPFHANKLLLDDTRARKQFSQILHFYELASGKRWNFRDLFSLVSHVLVGHESMFIVDDQQVPPCEWATYHADRARGTSPEAIVSAWSLASRLYTHAMFPTWPKFVDVAKNTRELEKSDAKLPSGFDKFFLEMANERDWENTEIGLLLGNELCLALDPANTSRELKLPGGLTIGEIEDSYTTSIQRGLELTSEHLNKIELKLIGLLSKADESCEPNVVSPLMCSKAKAVQWHLRALASRFIKRGIAGGAGICRDHIFLERYHALLNGRRDSMRRLKKSFQRLLSNSPEGFSISLSTTFGQPSNLKLGEACLSRVPLVPVKAEPVVNNESRPREMLPYLLVDKVPVPITFPLFKALSEVDEGLMTASLPGEIFASVDATRNLLAGRLVHNLERLENARVVIGECGQELTIEDGKVTYAQ